MGDVCDSCAFVPSSLLRLSCHGASPLTSAQLRRSAAGFQWSPALHRDAEQSASEQVALFSALLGADQLFTTPLLPQELLQGFAGPKHRAQLVERLSTLAFLQPVKDDHLEFGGSSKLPPTSRRANRNAGCPPHPALSHQRSAPADHGPERSRSRQARCLPPMGRQLRPGRIIRLACLGCTRTSSEFRGDDPPVSQRPLPGGEDSGRSGLRAR